MEGLANELSRDGRMAPSISCKKYFGVFNPLVTDERERDSFFGREGSFSLHMCHPSSCLGLLGENIAHVFLLWRGPFLCSSATPENTHEERTGLLE